MRLHLNNRQNGFTITEMLVGLFLASIVSLLVFTLFANNTRSTQFTNEVSTVHKNVRLTQLILSRELLNANNLGCKTGTFNTVNNVLGAAYQVESTFKAVDGGANAPDGFEFVTIENSEMYLDAKMTNSYSHIDVNTTRINDQRTLAKDDIVLITDCQRADIFVLSSVTDSVDTQRLFHHVGTRSQPENTNNFTNTDCLTGNDEHCLSIAYEAGSKVHPLIRRKFELIKDAGDDLSTLYVTENNSGKDPWVKGIEDLRMQYGLDTDGDDVADSYVNVVDDDDLTNIRTIKFFVLFASERTGIADFKSFVFADRPSGNDDITPDDGRYRYLLESVVQLRNRVGGQQ